MTERIIVVLVASGLVAGCRGDGGGKAPSIETAGDTKAAAPSRASGVDLPALTDQGLGLDPLRDDPAAIVVIATRTGIVVEGKAIVSIVNGMIPPDEVEGGALGMRVPKLAGFVRELRQAMRTRAETTGAPPPPADPLVVLYFDRAHRTDLFHRAVFSLAGGPDRVRRFGIAARTERGEVLVPLTLPERTAGSDLVAREGDARDAPVRPVVSVTASKLILWSFSGLEGTLAAPKLETTSPAELTAALAAIVARRWPDGQRPPAARELVVMADGAVPLQRLVEVMAASRADAQGRELFPDLVFSPGVE